MVPQECESQGMDLLIGSDQLWTIVKGNVIRSKQVQGLVAIKTLVGWTLQGPYRKPSPANQTTTGVTCVLSTQLLRNDRSKGHPAWNPHSSLFALYPGAASIKRHTKETNEARAFKGFELYLHGQVQSCKHPSWPQPDNRYRMPERRHPTLKELSQLSTSPKSLQAADTCTESKPMNWDCEDSVRS